MSCFRDKVAVVLGACSDNGRSGIEAVKRIMRHISCSGSADALAIIRDAEDCCGMLPRGNNVQQVQRPSIMHKSYLTRHAALKRWGGFSLVPQRHVSRKAQSMAVVRRLARCYIRTTCDYCLGTTTTSPLRSRRLYPCRIDIRISRKTNCNGHYTRGTLRVEVHSISGAD